MDILKNIYPAITSIGLIAATFYIIIKEFRSGSSELEKKTFASYKERNDQLEEIIPRLEAEVKRNAEQLAKLTGIVEEKDRHIKSLTEILQGRNPEVVDLLKEIKNLNTRIIDFMHQVNESTVQVLNYQTTMLEQQRGLQNTKTPQPLVNINQ